MHELRLGSVVAPVLYIDDDIIAVNKPAGLPVFTAAGKVAGTLTEVALASGVTLYDGEGVELPGVVHRLDKDTSGVMVLARSQAGWSYFKRQLGNHEAQKQYLALVWGTFVEKSGRIDVPIGAVHSRGLLLRQADSSGRPSTTDFEVIQHFGNQASLLRIRIELSLIHISEPTRLGMISYAVFCLKKKKNIKQKHITETTRTEEKTKAEKRTKQ